MLMPWVWIGLGLLGLKDYRLAILLYEILGCALPLLIWGGCKRLSDFWPIHIRPLCLFTLIIVMNITLLSLFKLTQGFGMDWLSFRHQAHNVKLGLTPYFWLFSLYIVTINPFLEESFWRGLIYRKWKSHLGAFRANLLSSFFFGAWHWLVLQHFCRPDWALVLAGCVMLGGVIFTATYEKTGSLGASVLLHALGADFPLVFVAYACLSRMAS